MTTQHPAALRLQMRDVLLPGPRTLAEIEAAYPGVPRGELIAELAAMRDVGEVRFEGPRYVLVPEMDHAAITQRIRDRLRSELGEPLLDVVVPPSDPEVSFGVTADGKIVLMFAGSVDASHVIRNPYSVQLALQTVLDKRSTLGNVS